MNCMIEINEEKYVEHVTHMLDDLNEDNDTKQTDVAALTRPFTQEETEKAILLFGTTDDLNCAGWILPDGRMLDFNRDYHKPGQEEWDEHGEISRAFSDERKAAAVGCAKSKYQHELIDGIRAGCLAGLIRIGGCPAGFYCDIAVKPTPEQYDRLYDCQDIDWQCDNYVDHEDYIFITGKRDLVYHDFDRFNLRFVNDVKKAFSGEA